ncbi:HAD family hydrolase [Roseibium marinum]|uniref:HAD superfamily hydrolase (TIGR01509 family) n=1 Tax=Roseibium marinum TaxID=281252 RepID=A0A2S3UTC7_9HYPH|nr:HAD family phosphatase [Roseibium marinum]POF30972.1 HAD superfamily hydrolase (TIGR01509 family) [Roseibium marinum]
MTVLEDLLETAQALIFDCDGTLLATPDLYAGAWQAAFAFAGQDMAAGWYHKRAGMSEHVLLDEFEKERSVVLDRESVVQAMRSDVLQRIGAVREISAVVGIARRFEGLKPMAVASGGPREIVRASLESAGLMPLFQTVVTMDDVAHAKPAPDLFLEAARRLGAAPADCLVFEDSRQGIQAAHNAGMRVVDVNELIAGDAISF